MTRPEPHSSKAIKTIELMNTKPSDWGLVEIKYKREKRWVPEKRKCLFCWGNGSCYVRKNGESHDFWIGPDGKRRACLSGFEREKDIKKYKLEIGTCSKCNGGSVIKWLKKLVWIGYPQWHKKTLFDSRFEDGFYQNKRWENATAKGKTLKCVCALCSKSITGIFSGLVPVTGKGADGKIHGMWVGEDCARKFFGVKNFKKKDHVLDINLKRHGK
jgi:hypothetical protein